MYKIFMAAASRQMEHAPFRVSGLGASQRKHSTTKCLRKSSLEVVSDLKATAPRAGDGVHTRSDRRGGGSGCGVGAGHSHVNARDMYKRRRRASRDGARPENVQGVRRC